MNIKNIFTSLFLLAIVGLITSCGGGSKTDSEAAVVSKRAGINEVVIHLVSDPDRLNFVTGTSADASKVKDYIFEALIGTDQETLEFFPQVAKALSKAEEVSFMFDGKMVNGLKFEYEIREEAKWNDGSPITGYDAQFYVKTIKNPKVDCESQRPYYEAIVDVKVDAANPKKLSVWFKDKYFMAEELSGLVLLQKSIYDPEGLMDKFTVEQLSAPNAAVKYAADVNINKFATMFNSESFSRDKIFGSGPYVFESWKTGERIILNKNPNWWGKALVGKEKRFSNYPDRIIFEIIVDDNTALTAQKDESIDVMEHRSKDYIKLKEDKAFLSKYKFELPIDAAYSYIGLNTKNPKLSDKKVRQALSMSFDYDTYLKVYAYGLAERTVSPIHPLKEYYNKDITPYPFDLTKAAALLEEAGWVDNNGDGVREKEIEGEDVPLVLEFKHASGSTAAENMSLMWKESLAKIGVKLNITSKEWTVFLEDIKSHNFEISTAGWSMGSGLSDMKQIWHTESYNGGSNYVGFGNAETDKLIESINYENNVEARNKMYFKIQEIIHDEAPYIFLFTSKRKLAIHKRFDNANGYNARPGYNAAEFKLNATWGAKPTAE